MNHADAVVELTRRVSESWGNSPQWIGELKREAMLRFEGMDWPSRSDEDWMRSDLRAFRWEKFLQGGVSQAYSPSWKLRSGVSLAGTQTLVDGQTVEEQLDPSWASKGVLFGSLRRLLEDDTDRWRPHLHSLIDGHADRFAALHAASWTDGTALLVPRGLAIEPVFHIGNLLRSGGRDDSHTLIVLEPGAEATVLTESNGDDGDLEALHCGGLELILGAGAVLRFVQLQDWNSASWHFAHQRAKLHRDASLQWTTAGLGSRFSQVSQQVLLAEPGANSQVNGVLFTQGRQQMTFNTLQQHAAPHCKSDFLYKAALQDRSRTVWRGMIQVDPGAIKTDGYQRNDNLLLSDQSRADSIPGLQIKADDVRCTHGSTSGNVDESLIFYAQSRGFTRIEAVRMIVSGFFQQIFDRITIPSVRDALGAAIATRVRNYE